VQCIFTYGTQLVPRQTMQLIGTTGRLEVEIPFNAPVDRPCRLHLYEAGPDRLGLQIAETIAVPTCDQYGIMADAFAASIQDDSEQPVPLEDSLANMRVIDAVFRAAERGSWEVP
jgi:predicted dehydrogenase